MPAYGSDAWLALADDHPARIAACVRAAETWAQMGDNLETDLRAEVEESRYAFKQTDDQLYTARKEAHRKEWRGLSLVRSNGRYADPMELIGEGPEGAA